MRSLILLGCLCFGLVACGDSHESLAKDSAAQLAKMADILSRVDGNTTQEDLEAKLKPIKKSFDDIRERKSKLGAPTAEDEQKIDAVNDTEVAHMASEMTALMKKLEERPELYKVAQDTLPWK
jgi:hypothetical protein